MPGKNLDTTRTFIVLYVGYKTRQDGRVPPQLDSTTHYKHTFMYINVRNIYICIQLSMYNIEESSDM